MRRTFHLINKKFVMSLLGVRYLVLLGSPYFSLVTVVFVVF